MRYGGNTSCVEVRANDDRIIFDAGTGLRGLGESLLKTHVRRATLLLSHTHWDHIDGFPFFAPIYEKKFSLAVLSGHLGPQEGGIRSVIDKQMSNPYFPVPIERLEASLTLMDFQAGDRFNLSSNIILQTAPLRHPGKGTGYRLTCRGKSVCYVTDTEHVPGRLDPNILGLIEGADLVIYDTTYTDDEFSKKLGWGHSTWQEGVRLAQAGRVKRLVLFHHDPAHEDDFMDRLEVTAQQAWRGCLVAREGMTLEV
jgi:phosphoribosyl 1,2-cyclic phosphodiesterase